MTSKTSILLVEDERIIARDLRLTLEENGYRVAGIAASADEAIAAVHEGSPDLVLMDVRIQGKLDGIETAALLKARFDLPVVFLTAHADEATLQRATRTEPLGYLVKPVTPSELRSAIAVALQRHDAEKRLRERERWFSTTLRSIADAVIAVDLAGDVVFMNATAEALTGASAEVARGRPLRDAMRLVGVDESPVEQALREGRAVEIAEAQLLDPTTGAIRIVCDSAAPVMDDAQRLGAVMVFRDVTEGRRLRQQLELADRLVSLGTMAAGVAHEINNPLAVIVGNAEHAASEVAWLRAELAGEERVARGAFEARLTKVAHALEDALSGARRIAHIVKDMKAFSQPQERSQAEADVARCVAWAVRVTATHLRGRASVVTRVDEVPPVAIDETRLGQVLVNLLVNAAHAIEPGRSADDEVTVSARREREHVAIEVRDTGAGIASADLARIFEPFFTTKGPGQGTGLGLSICHSIVGSVGGRIEAESAPGRGTTIRVTLPVASVQRAPVTPPPPTVEAPRRARILVVDDEPMMLTLFRRLLSAHEIVSFDEAHEALAYIERGERFDLVLCDVRMPAMSGLELYTRVLARDPMLAGRFVFVTGDASGALSGDLLAQIPNRVLTKPFDANQLWRAVDEALAVERDDAP